MDEKSMDTDRFMHYTNYFIWSPSNKIRYEGRILYYQFIKITALSLFM